MTSKKAPSGRRAVPPRPSDRTKAFTKDWTRLSNSGRYDMRRLKEVMLLLIANDAPLGQEWLDHPLQGEWSDHRECHVGGDFLLIYRLASSDSDASITFATSTGSSARRGDEIGMRGMTVGPSPLTVYWMCQGSLLAVMPFTLAVMPSARVV